MSTKSEVIGNAVLSGIDTLEAGAEEKLHFGANEARKLTKAGSRWAARTETASQRKARMLKRQLHHEAKQLRTQAKQAAGFVTRHTRTALASGERYVRNKPVSALAIASGAAFLLGIFAGRLRR
ncbi:MAG: hypothetical protein AB7T07_14780 [Steroidobacteraceae bacterium]